MRRRRQRGRHQKTPLVRGTRFWRRKVKSERRCRREKVKRSDWVQTFMFSSSSSSTLKIRPPFCEGEAKRAGTETGTLWLSIWASLVFPFFTIIRGMLVLGVRSSGGSRSVPCPVVRFAGCTDVIVSTASTSSSNSVREGYKKKENLWRTYLHRQRGICPWLPACLLPRSRRHRPSVLSFCDWSTQKI